MTAFDLARTAVGCAWLLVILAALATVGASLLKPRREPVAPVVPAQRSAPAAERVAPVYVRRPCRCGCPANMHDHLRDGADCGYCGRAICRSYRPDHRGVPQVVTPETVATPAGEVESTFAMWPAHADVNDLDLIARLTRENVRGVSTN